MLIYNPPVSFAGQVLVQPPAVDLKTGKTLWQSLPVLSGGPNRKFTLLCTTNIIRLHL